MRRPRWWRERGHGRADVGGPSDAVGSPTEEPPAAAPEDAEEAADVEEEAAAREAEALVEEQAHNGPGGPEATHPGAPFNRRSPFFIGFTAALGALIAYGLVQVVLQLSQVITLIVLSLFLSLGLEPIVALLVRRGVRRGRSVLLVIIGVAGVFALIGWLIVPPIVEQTTQLAEQTPGFVSGLRHNDLVQDLNARWHITAQVQQNLQDSVNEGTVTSLFGGVLGAGKAIVDGVVGAFTVLVLTLYFLVAMPRAKAAGYELVPRSRRARVVYLSEEISRRVGAYVLGQLCVATINAILSYIILAILGLPFAAVLATVVGLLALVPIVGTLIGGILVTLVALSSSWQVALIVLAYYVAYHAIEAYVLAPRIMRRAVEVPPAITIVAILAGGTLLGILGALIAIPVAAGLLLLYQQVAVPRQQRA